MTGMALRYDSVWVGLGGSPYFSSFFSDNVLDGTQEQAFVDAVEGLIGSYANSVSSALVWIGDSIITQFDPVTGDPTATAPVVPPTQNGTNAAEVLPLATQGLIHMRTGVYRAGREVRGRHFVPGPCESSNSAVGLPSAGYRGVLQAAADTFIADGSAGWAVWARPGPAGPGVIVPIIAAGTYTKWAVLRSRRD